MTLFPGTFAAAECAPAGSGGPSTELPGTYTVTVSSVPAITAGSLSTTFEAQAAPNVVSGLGTISTQATTTTAFIPAPGSTTSNPLFVSCTGTTSGPTTTSAPYYADQVGSVEITGVITSNSLFIVTDRQYRIQANPRLAFALRKKGRAGEEFILQIPSSHQV